MSRTVKEDISERTNVLRQKSLYFGCHSGLDPESSVFPLAQRPFYAGGNVDSLWSLLRT